MGVMGLQATYNGPNTSKKHPQHPVYPYLLRKLPITRPNHVWCSDITYIPVRRRFLYLVAIMDGRHARYCPGGYQTRWMPAFVLTRCKRPMPNMASPRL